jgi:hypothetical protein
VPGHRIGIAGGDQLEIGAGETSLAIGLDALTGAWRQAF